MGNSSALLEQETRPDSPAEVLAAARDLRRTADQAEADLLQLAVAWAVMHPVRVDHDDVETHRPRGFLQKCDLAIAGPGCPQVREFATEEFSAALGMGSETGKRYVGDALELC